MIDDYTRECLMIRVKQKLNSIDVIDVLTDSFILRGPPAFIRLDNGPEFVAETVRRWIEAVGAKTAYIEPGSPWENGYCESFNARFRDELLHGEIFYGLKEADMRSVDLCQATKSIGGATSAWSRRSRKPTSQAFIC